jgi:deoxyribose-phosphate aldolase
MKTIEVKDIKGRRHIIKNLSSDPSIVDQKVVLFTQQAEQLKPSQHRDLVKEIIGLIDLTTLEGSDNSQKIVDLCKKAQTLKYPELKSVAAVCVYPPFISQCKKLLAETSISVASVATGFPAGQLPLALKLAEVKYCLEQGVDEIDMVISRGKFLEGDFQTVFTEIESVAQLCSGKAHLKVILETGELKTLENIRLASDIALLAGADFIKTSTGKVSPAATMEASLEMMNSLADYFSLTGIKRGFKPAGGVRSSHEAIAYILMLENTLGKDWLDPSLFRFGASSLLDNLLSEF